MFIVSLKNDQGEYVPHGVMSLREAIKLQFETGHAVWLQSVGGNHG